MRKILSLNNIFIIPAVLTVSFALSQAVNAQESANRISWADLAQKLEQKGYTVHQIDTEYGGWEAEVTDKNNRRYELHLDKQGNIIRKEIDD